MQRPLRSGMNAVGGLFAMLALGLVVRMPWATWLWPFAMLETRLGFLFLGSIAAAIAASILWIALVHDDLRVAEAGALNLTVAFGGMTVFLVVSMFRGHRELWGFAAVIALFATSSACIYWWAKRAPWHDSHGTPPAPILLWRFHYRAGPCWSGARQRRAQDLPVAARV